MKVRTGLKAGQSQSLGAQGLGDSVAEFTHQTGLDKLAGFYTHLTGKDCGCDQRRQKLNQWFPYQRS
jgi:hypothetical protein